jgi:hypothetical protein
VGKAQKCVPMSRRLQLAEKATQSSMVGFFNPFLVISVVETGDRLAILLDKLARVELGI